MTRSPCLTKAIYQESIFWKVIRVCNLRNESNNKGQSVEIPSKRKDKTVSLSCGTSEQKFCDIQLWSKDLKGIIGFIIIV